MSMAIKVPTPRAIPTALWAAEVGQAPSAAPWKTAAASAREGWALS